MQDFIKTREMETQPVTPTEYSDVDTFGLHHLHGSRDRVGDLTVEVFINVVLCHLHAQVTPDRVQKTGLCGDGENYVHGWVRKKTYLEKTQEGRGRETDRSHLTTLSTKWSNVELIH